MARLLSCFLVVVVIVASTDAMNRADFVSLLKRKHAKQLPPGPPPPGQLSPEFSLPGQLPQGPPQPGQLTPELPQPGQLTPGQQPSEELPPGQLPAGQLSPGELPPGSPPHGPPLPGQPPMPYENTTMIPVCPCTYEDIFEGEKCIPDEWVCDGWSDCYGGLDEPDTCPCAMMCNDTCIPEGWICDNWYDCEDMSDEANCTYAPCVGYQCNVIFAPQGCIPDDFICDGYDDCTGDGSDEAYCPYDFSSSSVSSSSDSSWMSDECFHVCDDKCIPFTWICDNYIDCVDQSDEPMFCEYDECFEHKCQLPYMVEGCLPNEYVCDDVPDCVDGSDELMCQNKTLNIHVLGALVGREVTPAKRMMRSMERFIYLSLDYKFRAINRKANWAAALIKDEMVNTRKAAIKAMLVAKNTHMYSRGDEMKSHFRRK
ncbi:uncharacterized protein LOC100377096 [Saccoglossus kowalevskii]|uniref:Low-density lipoprotein receptor-related protein-like n=1 Tax=Saccoglossus kowalevskii TaxID=10224 RepID=A0ABM0GY69_SACKO|nr:PREDICTED: low-density lipoprotein receptor-related protein-like [Saccoglossus kowalevskii]